MARTSFSCALALALLACGGSAVTPGTDAAIDAPTIDAPATECDGDESCDDGLFCNGEERCTSSGCQAGDPVDCGARDCDEDLNRCECETDADMDGVCAADDCDDADDRRYPGNEEICDAEGHDEDCDEDTLGGTDADMDRFVSSSCCNGTTCGNDCDDANPARHHAQIEVCNAIDDDCDERVDEMIAATFYADADGDGFGDSSSSMLACVPPAGYTSSDGDCDDTRPEVHPAAAEVCDAAMVDENCDGVANEGCSCSTGATRPCAMPGACAAGTETCIGGAFGPCSIVPIAETCNLVDDDCDGAVDEGCP